MLKQDTSGLLVLSEPISIMTAAEIPANAEWLEADGMGGFASGPVNGPRTRRYQALLLTATNPPTGRVVQVNGVEAHVVDQHGTIPISTNRYLPDVLYPDGWRRLISFKLDPWPIWTFDIGDGRTLDHEIFVARDTCETVMRWRVSAGAGSCKLSLRLLMSGRDYHGMQHENAGFDFTAKVQGGNVAWRPYPGLPAIGALTNGNYRHAPEWFRNVVYNEEQERGLDAVEDVASPGVFTWNLGEADAVLVLRSGDGLNTRAAAHAGHLAQIEAARRAASPSWLEAGADSYLVDREGGRTLLAGFPWFTDWGRDTFIAMRGLVIARGCFAEAEAILTAWAATVSEGMLPNRFVDAGDAPEFNSVDASLWFIVTGDGFIKAAKAANYRLAPEVKQRLHAAFEAILQAYETGTRFGIGADQDGLLRAGVPGVQLTWMDAKVGDWVVTPRIGKPVEIQALWINALHIGGAWSQHWADLKRTAQISFANRFPDPDTGGLYDVVDVDHVAGTADGSVRPNQIFAVGGLPFSVIEGALAQGVVDLVESKLLTTIGLRSLASDDPAYKPHYGGDAWHRDGAYHQGTVWPWLIGPFVDAWLRVQGNTDEAKASARRRFLSPFAAHLRTAGLGHVSEIADGDAPHTPRGCPFQAWSLGELIRIDRLLR